MRLSQTLLASACAGDDSPGAPTLSRPALPGASILDQPDAATKNFFNICAIIFFFLSVTTVF